MFNSAKLTLALFIAALLAPPQRCIAQQTPANVNWIRPESEKSSPVWGIHGGIVVGLWLTLQQLDVKDQLKQITERLTEHDVQLNQIYDAMENFLDGRIAQKKWEERERIGFKK